MLTSNILGWYISSVYAGMSFHHVVFILAASAFQGWQHSEIFMSSVQQTLPYREKADHASEKRT